MCHGYGVRYWCPSLGRSQAENVSWTLISKLVAGVVTSSPPPPPPYTRHSAGYAASSLLIRRSYILAYCDTSPCPPSVVAPLQRSTPSCAPRAHPLYCPLPFYLNCTAIPTLNLNSNSALVLAWRRQHWLIVVLGVGSRVRLVQRTQSVRCDIRQHVWRGPSRRVSHSKQDCPQQVAGAGQYNADRRAVIDRRACPPSLHLAYLLPESL